jgi:hypothetical protein
MFSDMTTTKVDFDTIDIAALTDVPLLTTAGYVSLIEALVSVAPSAPTTDVTRALDRVKAGLVEAKQALVERLGDEVDTALERSFDSLVDQLWISLRGQLEFWQLYNHAGTAMLTEGDRAKLDLETCRELAVIADMLGERMFGAANGGTEFLRMNYPQQSAHMGSRLQLIDAQGHTQSFNEELVISRAATFVNVCQDRYEAMVKDRASRDGGATTDLRELRTSLRRTIRLYAMAVTGMLDEKDQDSPVVVQRALFPIVAAQPQVRRAQGDAGAEGNEEAEQVPPLEGSTPAKPDGVLPTDED